MAHFAKLDSYDFVIEVNVVNNLELLDKNGNESEQKGINFLIQWSNGHTNWVQTSYNNNFRGRFAEPGSKYLRDKNIFTKRQPFKNWVLDENNEWQAPYPAPDDGIYTWQEPQGWVKQAATKLEGA